jgi:hypothetical protein
MLRHNHGLVRSDSKAQYVMYSRVFKNRLKYDLKSNQIICRKYDLKSQLNRHFLKRFQINQNQIRLFHAMANYYCLFSTVIDLHYNTKNLKQI